MKNRINSFVPAIVVTAIIVTCASCADEAAPGFSPIIDPKAVYNFRLASPEGNTDQFNLTGITQQASKEGNDRWVFLLKGNDKTRKCDVYISGLVSQYDSYLNIAVVPVAGSASFYKDCNSFRCEATTGKDNRGNFVRINYFNSQCVTPTLASERSMDIKQYQVELSAITFYVQQ